MKATVNDALGIIQQLATRLKQVEAMKEGARTRTRHLVFGNQPERIEEPMYDVKKVDIKSVKLTNAISALNRAVKASNAVTQLEIDVNLDDLMSPIE